MDYLFNGYWRERGDPRVANLIFMGSFGPPLAILGAWSLFVLYLGPRWMSTRKPFSLKPLLIVYNISLSLMNVYFLARYLMVYNYGQDMFNVRFPAFTEMSPKIQTIISLNHLYMFSKFVDLLDTIFFVLRKKQSQVTGLHFFHHLTVPFISWTYFRLCANNAYIIPFQLLNSVAHTLMYGYYGLSALGPQMAPYLWWKRYITQFQIVQFVALFGYAVYFTLFQKGYDFFYSFNLLTQSMLYAFLFTRFYQTSYQLERLRKAKLELGDLSSDINNAATCDIIRKLQ